MPIGNHILFFTGICLISLVAVLMLGTQRHENAHSVVAGYYTCNRGEITYSIFGTAYFQCIDFKKHTQTDYDTNRYMDSLNEIIGYNMDVISVGIIFGSFMVSLAILMRGD